MTEFKARKKIKIQNRKNVGQCGLCKGVSNKLFIRFLLSDILKKLPQGREHLGAFISNIISPKAIQYFSQR